MNNLKKIFISLIVLIFLHNCNKKNEETLDKYECEIINIVINERLFPGFSSLNKTNYDLKNLKSLNEIELQNEIGKIILDNQTKNSYEFLTTDSLYKVNDINSKYYLFNNDFGKYGKYNYRLKQNEKINYNIIKIRSNLKRVLKENDKHNYLGSYKFSRVIFNDDVSKACVIVKNYKNNLSDQYIVYLNFINGQWVVE